MYIIHIGGTDSLQIFDVSNPASPTLTGSIVTGSQPRSVQVQGRYAYVVRGDGSGTLQIFDVSNPASPASVGSVAAGNDPRSVYTQGRYAYVANYGSNTLQIINISNPASPTSVGSVATDTQPNFVSVQGRYAYVTNQSSNTLQIFDLGGAYVQQLETGGVETSTLSVQSSGSIGGNLSVQGGLTVLDSSQFNGNIGIGGQLDVTGSTAFKRGTDFSTTGSSDNVNFGDVSLIRLTGASAQTITGIAGGRDGKILTMMNAASQDATLANNSGSSSAANRIVTGTGSDMTLAAGSSVTLIYDSGASLWRIIGSTAADPSGFIQNGTSPQTADFNITGNGVIGGTLAVNGGDLTTTSTTFNLLNTDATTINAFGAATTISLGASTGTTTINNGLTLAAGKTLTVNGDALTDLTGSGLINSSGALTVDDTSATGFFRNGGNSFGGAAILGTNDNNVLNLETNNVNRFQIAFNSSKLTGQGTTEIDSTGALFIGGNGSNGIAIGNSGISTGQIAIGNTTSVSNVDIQASTALNLGGGGAANTIQIGNTTGAVTQTINIGNNSTASSTNNVNIGSSVAGTTAITGATTITNRTSGSADTLIISNSTSTGNILQARDNATAVFTIADGGATTFNNQTNSTTAFQIQNSSGTSLFTADTTNMQLHTSTIVAPVLRASTSSVNGLQLQFYNGTSFFDANSFQGTVGFGAGGNNASIAVGGGFVTINSNVGAGRKTLVLNQVNGNDDILSARNNGTTVFTVGQTGNILSQNSTNSTTAFRIQNAGAQNLFVADTTNQRVAIGPAAVPANGALTIGTNTTANTGGIWFGTDTNLYRGAANTLQTDDSFLVQTAINSTTAFSIQNSSSTGLLNADTTNMRITIGGATGSLTGRALEVTSVDVTTTLRVGDSTNGISFNDQVGGKLRFRGTAQNDISVTLSPEYAGAVLTGDGTNNVGTMTSDFCSGSSLLNIGTSCGANEDHNFYSWTANATNDYDIYVKWKVPSDFASFAATPVQFYGWKTGGSDAVQLRVYKSGSGTVCDNDSLGSSGSWALVTSNPTTSCSINAGDELVFRITLTVASNGNYARAGEIFINYKSQF